MTNTCNTSCPCLTAKADVCVPVGEVLLQTWGNVVFPLNIIRVPLCLDFSICSSKRKKANTLITLLKIPVVACKVTMYNLHILYRDYQAYSWITECFRLLQRRL